jgi:hypothetical protein
VICSKGFFRQQLDHGLLQNPLGFDNPPVFHIDTLSIFCIVILQYGSFVLDDMA